MGELWVVGMMNEVTHPPILFLQGSGAPAAGPSPALVLIATVTRGQDESDPHGQRSFLFQGEGSLSPPFCTQGAVFLKITRIGYNTIIWV